MIPFNSHDPFPLLACDSYSLKEAQEHAEQVDGWLGIQASRIEAELLGPRDGRSALLGDEVENWIGLPLQSLLTPYVEFRSLLELLKPAPGTTVVDLGAGYGRMAWVLAAHYPGVRFIGYELVRERVEECLRCLGAESPKGIDMIHADLSSPDLTPAPAEIYFIYDFGSRRAIEKTLQDLRRVATQSSITVVGRGRSSRDAIERDHPWLSQVITPQHTRNFSIYRSG